VGRPNSIAAHSLEQLSHSDRVLIGLGADIGVAHEQADPVSRSVTPTTSGPSRCVVLSVRAAAAESLPCNSPFMRTEV
jgi:hypothetical protein